MSKSFNTRIASLLAALFCVVFSAVASDVCDADGKGKAQDRRQWMREMRQAKTEFVIKQLGLTEEQAAKFTPLYNQMSEELDRARHEVNRLRHSVTRKKDATDLEYTKAAEAQWELKGKESLIEMRYLPKFKEILTPQQLFKMPSTEMQWMRKLMDHRKK